MRQLRFLNGPLTGRMIPLGIERFRVGSGGGNHLLIDEATIAPRHVILILDGDEYTLRVNSASEAARVNDLPVVKQRLKPGDRIRLGKISLSYEAQPTGEILSLDTELPAPQKFHPDPEESRQRQHPVFRPVLLGLLAGGLFLAFAASVVFFLNRSTPVSTTEVVTTSPKTEVETPAGTEAPESNPKDISTSGKTWPTIIGSAPASGKATGRIHRTSKFPSHQAAIDQAKPGDSVIFDSEDKAPIVVSKPLEDIQFLSGRATWEINADVFNCQFILHSMTSFVQKSGKMEYCLFHRCKQLNTHLLHTDFVTFTFDERSSFSPADTETSQKPLLNLEGFIRNVCIVRPVVSNSANRYDTRWQPVIRLWATDSVGNGSGSYILSPIIRGQRAWTPFRMSGTGMTFAHSWSDGNSWADPVLDIAGGTGCVVLCTSLGSATETTPEQYTIAPRILQYRDRSEFGNGTATASPAFRGAAINIQGLGNRIVAHGDATKTWSRGRRLQLPSMHYADGIVAIDPAIQQYLSAEEGGLSINFAPPLQTFLMQKAGDSVTYRSSEEKSAAVKYPLEGPNLYRPVFVPLGDLRMNAGEFDTLKLTDMTGKSGPQIEMALSRNENIYLGPGKYEFKGMLTSGFIIGAGMNQTTLVWPANVDCMNHLCKGVYNATVSGGSCGLNARKLTTAAGPRTEFLRTRFDGQKDAAIALHSATFAMFQDCEFVGCRVGFSQGQDLPAGSKKTPTLENLNLLNCTFRKVAREAITLKIDSAKQGHVGIQNCRFEDIGGSAIVLSGGQTHLMQQCKFQSCSSQAYVPTIKVQSKNGLVMSHLEIDNSAVRSSAIAVQIAGDPVLSRLKIVGSKVAINCDGVLAADHLSADASIIAKKDSLYCSCRFPGVQDGVFLVDSKTVRDVTKDAVAPLRDTTSPPDVKFNVGLYGKTLRKISWEPVNDPESGVVQYVIYSRGLEIGRTGFEYEPPSTDHPPFVKLKPTLEYFDTDLRRRGYEVRAINGAGLLSGGVVAQPRSIGPARGIFLNKLGVEVFIRGFDRLNGKGVGIVTEESKKSQSPLSFGRGGLPNIIRFEPGTLPDAPIPLPKPPDTPPDE